MKKTVILFTMLILTISLYSAENKIQTDIGLSFYGFENPPTFFLKIGNDKIKLRFGDLIFGIGYDENYDPSDNALMKINSYNIGASTGMEINNQVIENFNFTFGFDVYGKYANTFQQRCDTTEIGVLYSDSIFRTYVARFNLMFGANYSFFDRFVISFEYKPYFRYDHILTYYGREDVGIDLTEERKYKNCDFYPKFYIILSYRF